MNHRVIRNKCNESSYVCLNSILSLSPSGVWGSHFQPPGFTNNDCLPVLLEPCGEARETEVQQLPPNCGIIRQAAGILVAVPRVCGYS